APARDTGLCPAVDAQPGAVPGVLLRRRSVVEAVLRVPDVAERVDLRGGLQIEGVQPVVAVELVVGEHVVPGGGPRAGGVRLEGVHGVVEAEPLPGADQPGRRGDAVGGQPVDGAQFVVRSEDLPGRVRRPGAGEFVVRRLVHGPASACAPSAPPISPAVLRSSSIAGARSASPTPRNATVARSRVSSKTGAAATNGRFFGRTTL